ncbi:MAG TPA: acyl-CoA dehydrogenase family protein [Bacteroidales bacterium]|nr:acyl-CoA dehydrogenase family protein [Bacteroidales bacterium]HPS17827.1 acyl-CoA dehydrogenase family protein [Bacteroidales bacterium]
MESKKVLKGGEFLLRESKAADVFIPEEFDEEQKMISGMCNDFLEREVFPVLDKIDAMEPGLMRSLVAKSGEQGLLGISVPEEYGGFGQSFVTSMLASDVLGAGYSYAVAYSAHTGIGTLPILYYGSEELKQKYLPKLASGEYAGAYCLTEPNAGSDANSGKTKAVLSEDGKHYILNGQKMWITNGGFADVLTVFAKIDNDKILSAFVVERNFPGVSFNPEEKKMGIKGSSTVQIFFNDCKVPVENMLGKRGEGFRIALNILHIGRIKLGANVLGACRRSIMQSVNYANERKQFGSLISNFGAIKYKLAEQVIRFFVAESSLYRTSKNVDNTIKQHISEGMPKPQAYLEALGEYAMEAAILKVLGSETLNYIVDEFVQIYGGMGYSAEMPADRAYRDSRINRIFEGTNEINRLVASDMFLKMAKKADSKVFDISKAIYEQLDSIKENGTTDYFAKKYAVIENLKKAALLMLGKAYDAVGKQYNTEQETMMSISDMLVQLYAAESVVLRVEKLKALKSEQEHIIYKDICDVFVYEASSRIYKSAMDALNSFATGEEFAKIQNGLRKLTSVEPTNIKEARRRIANKLIEDNRYNF